ncbi:MAG TPA: 6-phosphogluconolactonase, partial [Verrucomicrobiales bacterium]|nr:6-phosphogluconolactonase [Verrucomicrobiales bacterium]
ANYGGGSVISYQLESDGRIGAQASFVQHEGSSVNPNRQKAPHAHGIYLDQAARFAFVPDLGMDKVLVYRFDATTGKLTPNDPAGVAIEPGSGPRHFALHPTKPLAWSLNEMVSTITSLKYDPVRGTLEPTTTVSTLPAGPVAGNSTAEIFVHPNGKFLYASNRGHDSIAVFQIDGEAGALTPVQHEPIAGRTPRSFVLDAGGRWLLAAGQSSDTIAIFRLDPETGRITRTGNPMTAPTPVCLVFAAR